MPQSARALLELRLRAKDGKIGKAADFYFDEEDWKIQNVVVNTGGWLSRHGVLLAPEVFAAPEGSAKEVLVSLTRKQIRESAGVESVETLSQHEEELLRRRYGEDVYAEAAGPGEAVHGKVSESALEIAEAEDGPERGERSLRSVREIMGYQVEAEDGPCGVVHDFVIGDGDWTIHYLVIDRKDVRLPNPKVLAPTSWVELMSWPDSRVYFKVAREKVKASQKYDAHSHGHLEKPRASGV
jgi:hypothetical protein